MSEPDWTSRKPFAGPDDPVTSTCWDCGATWRRGESGHHSCVAHLKTHALRLAEEVRDLKAEKEGRESDLQCEGAERDEEIARLTEEVERLKVTTVPLDNVPAIMLAERLRIRRELLAELEGVKHIARESFLPMIDRLVPGEG